MPRSHFPKREALPEHSLHSAQTIPARGIERRKSSISPLELVRLPPLMERSQGRSEIAVALIDGPVVVDHPELAGATIREIAGNLKGACTRPDTMACTHATFVAGILSARRSSVAPAICPGCTLLLRPIFGDTANRNGHMPSATPEELAEAIIDSVKAGAYVINLSSALMHASPKSESKLTEALSYAAHRGAMIVAASGNQGTVGGSVMTRHPWVIAVAACDSYGRPLSESNLGGSIGRRGLSAPGENITSLGTNGEPQTLGGTSAAAPFVTGAIALVWSEFREARAADVKAAITRCGPEARSHLVPPLLNAWAAYQMMASARHRRIVS